MALTDPVDEQAVEAAQRIVAAGRRVVALTGAGISTDSGIPDFRGPQGVWTKDPKAERTSRLADYLEDPEVRAQAWQNRLNSPVWAARPNAGHLALADLEAAGRLAAVLTQNIDGLHVLAAHDPDRVVELHGSMRGVVCWSCGAEGPMQPQLDRARAGDADPRCERCGGIQKSTTVSFGQALDPEAVARADRAVRACDVLLAVGTTLTVHPAAGFAPTARRHGATLVILNGEATAYDHLADVAVRGPISEILPILVTPVDGA